MNEKNRCSSNDMYEIMSGIGRKKPSKYRAKRTQNNDGTFSDSRKEAVLDAEFMSMVKNKGVLSVVRKERFAFILNDIKICSYECDWAVYYRDGRKEVFDAKGVKTPVYKIKKKMMKAFFNIDIQEV